MFSKRDCFPGPKQDFFKLIHKIDFINERFLEPTYGYQKLTDKIQKITYIFLKIMLLRIVDVTKIQYAVHLFRVFSITVVQHPA